MNVASEPRVDRRYRGAVALGLVALALGYGILAAASTLWDRDEPRFARAAVEMVESGDYLVPTFNAKLRPDKPAMVYWAMSVPLQLIENKTLAVRLPSIVGLLCAAGMTFLIGRRMFGARVGLWAMGLFATALNAMVIGTAATADGVLLAWIMLAIWTFVEMVYRGPRWWHYVLFAAALGGAQLTKGPVGLAVPGLAVLGAAWGGRGGAIRITRGMWIGIAVATLVSIGLFLAWALPANNATGGDFAEQGFVKHVIERILSPSEGHGLSGLLGYLGLAVAFYPIALIVGFFPWTLLLPAAISATLRKQIGDRRERAILVGWALPTFVMMCLVSTKLPHYIVPIYPALAIACAATLTAHQRGELSEKDRDWLRGGIWFFLPVALTVLGGIVTAGAMLPENGFALPVGIVGAAVVIMAVMAVRDQLAERSQRAARIALFGMAACLMLVARLFMPLLEQTIKISPEIADVVRASASADVPIFTQGYEEPSMMFYLDRPPNAPVQGLREPIAAWLKRPGKAVLVTTRKKLGEVELPQTARKMGEFPTVNYAGGMKRLTVIVIGRNLNGVPRTAE